MRASLSPGGWLIGTGERRAEGDELEPLVAGRRHAHGLGIETHEAPGLELDVLAVDGQRPGALDDEHDLLLPLVAMVVLASAHPRRQREVVEAERPRAERAARLLDGAARALALEVGDVDDAVRGHRGKPTSRARPRRVAPAVPQRLGAA